MSTTRLGTEDRGKSGTFCGTCFDPVEGDFEKHLDVCPQLDQSTRIKLTDRKHIKVGDKWFDMHFFSDGSIQKYCISDMRGTSEDHRIVADYDAKHYWCKDCDWMQA
jgi:hypothetical protein